MPVIWMYINQYIIIASTSPCLKCAQEESIITVVRCGCIVMKCRTWGKKSCTGNPDLRHYATFSMSTLPPAFLTLLHAPLTYNLGLSHNKKQLLVKDPYKSSVTRSCQCLVQVWTTLAEQCFMMAWWLTSTKNEHC